MDLLRCSYHLWQGAMDKIDEWGDPCHKSIQCHQEAGSTNARLRQDARYKTQHLSSGNLLRMRIMFEAFHPLAAPVRRISDSQFPTETQPELACF